MLSVFFMLAAVSAEAREEEREFVVFNASNGMAANGAQTIKCTRTGRMVMTTIGHINFYDGSSFTHIDPTQNDAFPLPKYNGHYHLYFDKYHHLWLKDKYLVTCVDLLTERFISDVRGVIESMGMKRKVDDLFVDNSGHVWFLSGKSLYGTDYGGEFPVGSDAFLQELDVYGEKQLLEFFSDGSVVSYDIESGKQLYRSEAFSYADRERYSASSVIFPYKDGYLQIRNGEKDAVLLYFDVKLVKWERLMTSPYHLNNLAVHNGSVYIACEFGYWVYNLQTGQSTHVEELKLSMGRRLKTDVNALAFDRQGGLWIGTEKRGLLYARPFLSPFVSYSWDNPLSTHYYQLMADKLPPTHPLPRRVNCIYRDSRGWTWTGTYSGLKLTKRNGKTHDFMRRDGLMNEMIHSVVEDKHHDIWAATSYGISHLYIRNDSVYHIESFYSQDNVPSESFVNGMAACMDDGTIIMQSLDHMVTFNPDEFDEDSIKRMVLYPKLIRLMVNGYEVKAGEAYDGNVILERAITRTAEISVKYNQNSVSLTFSGLNYMRPRQTYYRVRVKGAYDGWRILSYSQSGGLVDSRGMLHLPLLGLRPGEYKVELQASLSPDIWPQEPFVWKVIVKEPWWRTTGVYLTLLLVLAILFGANFYYFNRNTRLRMMRNNEESDILRRIRAYAEQCAGFDGEVLTPYTPSVIDGGIDMDTAFMDAMSVIVPYVWDKKDKPFTMGDLAAKTNVSVPKLYELLSANLYKSPRPLIGLLRLQDAQQLLSTTKLSIEDIAERCGFSSPNYFIASFYHAYRQTPDAYRSSTAR